MKQPETPFPRHWFYYIALKLAILVIALAIALYVFGIL
jgi:hypothetical protein